MIKIYTLFHLFEEIIQKIFKLLSAKSFNTETIDTILYRIISSQDVHFQRSLLSARDKNSTVVCKHVFNYSWICIGIIIFGKWDLIALKLH